MAKTKTNDESTEPATGAIVPVQQAPHWSAPRSLMEAMQLAEMMAKGGVLPDVRNAGQALLKIMVGAELGFGPSASLIGVHIVEGRPSVGANLIAAAIRRSGRYDYILVEGTAQRCEIQFFRLLPRKELLGTESMSMQEAIDTGLALGKDGRLKANYARSGTDMLFARVITRGFRRHCPDLIGGAVVYDPDELDTCDTVTVQSPPSSAPASPVSPAPRTEPEVQDAEVEPAGKPQTSAPVLCSEDQIVRYDELVRELRLPAAALLKRLGEMGASTFRQLTAAQAASVLEKLEAKALEARARAEQPASLAEQPG